MFQLTSYIRHMVKQCFRHSVRSSKRQNGADDLHHKEKSEL